MAPWGKNWTPAQNGRRRGVGAGSEKNTFFFHSLYFLLIASLSSGPTPTPSCFAVRTSPCFTCFSCVKNREAQKFIKQYVIYKVINRTPRRKTSSSTEISFKRLVVSFIPIVGLCLRVRWADLHCARSKHLGQGARKVVWMRETWGETGKRQTVFPRIFLFGRFTSHSATPVYWFERKKDRKQSIFPYTKVITVNTKPAWPRSRRFLPFSLRFTISATVHYLIKICNCALYDKNLWLIKTTTSLYYSRG